MITDSVEKACVNSCVSAFIEGITQDNSIEYIVEIVQEYELLCIFDLQDINDIVKDFGLAILAISETVDLHTDLAQFIKKEKIIDARYFNVALLSVVLSKYHEWIVEFEE